MVSPLFSLSESLSGGLSSRVPAAVQLKVMTIKKAMMEVLVIGMPVTLETNSVTQLGFQQDYGAPFYTGLLQFIQTPNWSDVNFTATQTGTEERPVLLMLFVAPRASFGSKTKERTAASSSNVGPPKTDHLKRKVAPYQLPDSKARSLPQSSLPVMRKIATLGFQTPRPQSQMIYSRVKVG
ncbi:hypothetical protein HanPI659440_Chr08g0304591 [Helianthus annuus]|nr:hypothetical protein HanPI659440_Chr08g0304591 [Helianthus annuus]